MGLAADLYRILLTDWSENELRALAVFAVLVIVPTIRELLHGEP